ncbi:hypothetical protein Btru_040108 [Bulinus truncatus]|nr:hypothetical protein Btru_040108 [Bulinus truncatus]
MLPVRSYLVRVVVVFVLWAVEYSDGLAYRVTDLSKSNVCTDGLLEGADNLTLDIVVSIAGDNITDDRHFVFGALGQADNVIIQLCFFQLWSNCTTTHVTDCCTCHQGDNDTYTLKYVCAAHSDVSNKLIVINGETVKNVTFPRIYKDEPASLTINDYPVTDVTDCHTEVAVDSIVQLNICTTDLTSTRLTLYYHGSEIGSSHERCLNVSVYVNETRSTVYLRQVDSCDKLFRCSLWGNETVDPKTNITASLPVLPKIILNTSAKVRIVAVICVLMSASLISTLIYCKIRRLYCFEGLFSDVHTSIHVYTERPDAAS